MRFLKRVQALTSIMNALNQSDNHTIRGELGLKTIAFIGGFVFLVLLLYAVVVLRYANAIGNDASITRAGQFGDMFGGVSAISNVCALLVLAYSLRQQTVAIRQQTASLQQAAAAHTVNTLDILHRRWTEPSMLMARMRACEALKKKNGTLTESMQHIAEYFEHVAVLRNSNAIGDLVLWEIHSYYIEVYFRVMEQKIKTLRAKINDTTAFDGFEKLYSAMSEISRSKGVSHAGVSIEAIEGLLNVEIDLAKRLLGSVRSPTSGGSETPPNSKV